MRNTFRLLDDHERRVVEQFEPTLNHFHETQAVVRLDYFKRDGSTSHSIGTVSPVDGNESFVHVKVFTNDKGVRTINVYNIRAITPV